MPSFLSYLVSSAFPGRRVAWGRVRADGRGGVGGGDRMAFGWPERRGFPLGVQLTPSIGSPGVLRAVPIDGPVERADLHIVPTDEGLWCLAVEADSAGDIIATSATTQARTLEKQDILLHTIVHDLASPLSGIVGCLSAIEDGVQDADQLSRLVGLALRQAHRQESLIQQILDVFKATNEENPEPVTIPPDVGVVSRRLVESLEPSFALHRVGLRFEDQRTMPRSRVVGEETRLERVLANLLDNGLRHAPEGSEVQVQLSGDAHHAQVSVLDSGPGVPPEKEEELFQKLRQGENRGKLGLGLYFCRITVQRWGGQLGYAARRGGGSRFWFSLPWSREAQEDPPKLALALATARDAS